MVENLQAPNRCSRNQKRTGYVVNGTTALGVIVVLGMLGLGIAELLEARSDAWKQAVDASDNITLAVSQEIERNIESYDLSLKGAISALEIPGIGDVSPRMRHAALFDTSSTANYLGTILVLDKNGDIKWSSIEISKYTPNYSDRDYFQALKDTPQDALYISRPFLSRLRNADPSIAFVRRLNNPDGSFDGIVQGAMRLEYFQDLFRKLNLGPGGSMALTRTDGRLLARRPFDARLIDQDLNATGVSPHPKSEIYGHYQKVSAADGVERFYTFRRVGELPLELTTGISINGVYAAWWGKAIRVGLILTALSAITCVLCLFIRNEMKRRMGAESALSDAADKLSLIANTDSLTGLANRRAFDVALEVEWRRAIRSELPVALIMIDADYFKLYNDRYGHPDGDRILQAIAACIDKSMRRPADFAARYGGEEFVVILPETERAGALMIAERIRASVEALKIVHEGSPLGQVTVSAGLAWEIPKFGTTQDSLLKDCDLALYRSKHLCRNTVSVSDLHLVQVKRAAF